MICDPSDFYYRLLLGYNVLSFRNNSIVFQPTSGLGLALDHKIAIIFLLFIACGSDSH